MNVTLRIPDELAQRLAADGGNLKRRALEGFALGEYRAGRLTAFELRQLLDIPTRYELDGFLKACPSSDVGRGDRAAVLAASVLSFHYSRVSETLSAN
jgi:hypothetical protein